VKTSCGGDRLLDKPQSIIWLKGVGAINPTAELCHLRVCRKGRVGIPKIVFVYTERWLTSYYARLELRP